MHIEQPLFLTKSLTSFTVYIHNVVGITINFRVRFSCVFIDRHSLFLRDIKSFSWKPCSFRRFPFRLNINCDFIYSWQEVDPRRPRTRDITFACKCIDELLINVCFDLYLLLCEFVWTLTDNCVNPDFIKLTKFESSLLYKQFLIICRDL